VNEELALAVADVVILPTGRLPKTSSGKVQRARTRQLYLEGALQRMAEEKRLDSEARRRGRLEDRS
jgi:acyl-CoA synthetase (AMP-forming)/AMP-acid ligase II